MRFAALEFALPVALWGLLAALPIVAFHLYFRRRRRVFVAFAPLLVESAGLVRSEARFRRLRDFASLALRLLALTCAVLALAGLRPVDASPPARDLLLVIDADITTAAREADGVLRLELARRLAQDFVRAQPARAGDLDRTAGVVGVVLAAGSARLLLAPTDDRARALGRLALPLVPEATRVDLTAAVSIALAAATERAAADIVVLTARPVVKPSLPAHVGWRVVGTGSVRDDQGFVDFALERAADGGSYVVRATVRNDAAVARERTLIVRVGDVESARETLVLGPEASRDVTFEVTATADPKWLELALQGADAFPGNDAVLARLAPGARPAVLVVHDGAVRPYTAAVIEALAAEGLVDAARGGYVRGGDLGRAPAADVVLVDGVALPRTALVPGAYLFLAPLAGALPFEIRGSVDRPLLWRMAAGHPLVAGLSLEKAYVARGQALAGEGLVPLAWAEDAVMIAEGERGGVRYVVLGLDPEGSALPLQLALPRLVRQAVLRLARAPAQALAPLYRPGEILRPLTPLPGGPQAELVWGGSVTDPVLAEVGRGHARAALAPDG
ncbi:MAG: BatA domain-containing protein, partial [Planctomycetota bacterium]|nr:BatA domain-containing protein [Planctomycetota bacterium]